MKLFDEKKTIQEEKVEETPENIGEKEFQKEKEKRKSKEIYRHLGYHRDYLTEKHRIVKTIALIIVIVIAVLLIMKYMVPDDIFYQSLEQAQSGSAILSRLFLW